MTARMLDTCPPRAGFFVAGARCACQFVDHSGAQVPIIALWFSGSALVALRAW